MTFVDIRLPLKLAYVDKNIDDDNVGVDPDGMDADVKDLQLDK